MSSIIGKKRRDTGVEQAASTQPLDLRRPDSLPNDTLGFADAQSALGNQAVQRAVLQNAQSSETAPLAPAKRPTLRRGARGEDVVYLQRRLNIYGASLVEDGIWGNLTQSAVVDFQSTHELIADGVVGSLTWDKLDTNPADLGVPGVDFTDVDPGLGVNETQPAPKEPKLADLRTQGAGPFQTFVAADVLDADTALLLNFMAKAPAFSWARDSAEFIFQELGNGNLVGMVKAADRRKLLSKLPQEEHAGILGSQVPDFGAAYVPIGAKINRGWTLIGDNFFPSGPLRFQMLVLSHELNHHRNRKIADFMENEPIAKVNNPDEYVLPDVAAKFAPGVQHTRKQFVVEIVARHVAWHVAQQYDTKIARTQPFEKVMPALGALFKAAFDFAKADPAAYHDNGYIPELASRGDAVLGKQVALWMRNAARMEFHGLAVTSDAVGRFFLLEFEQAKAAGFTPSGQGDGLA